jgi:hypothetical protein
METLLLALSPYENFLFGLRAPETKRQYPHRLDKFLVFMSIQGTIQDKCSKLYIIANENTTHILSMIRKGKEIFEKWKNGEILLDNYIEKYVTNPIKKQELINLKEKIGASHSSEEVTQYQNKICDIVLLIEQRTG